MNGYFNEKQGVKDLRLALLNVVQKLDCSNLSFINSKVIPTKDSALNVLRNMSQKDFINYGMKGDKSASDLSVILGTIVGRTRSSGEISLLVSDFIFCPSKANGLTSLGPDAEKVSITNVFKNKNLAVAIFKFSGEFSGTFYTGHFDKNGQEIYYKIQQKRPFYIWAIGGEREIGWLMKKVDLSNVGIQNSLCLTMGGKSVEYHLVPRKGIYDVDRRDNKHAVSASKGRNGFVLDFEASLQDLPLPEEYLCDTANYTTSDDNYVVESVRKVDGKYRISIRGTKVRAGNLSVNLKMRIPQWVEDCDMNPEWDIRKAGYGGCTFGFKALVSGVLDAMSSSSEGKYVMFNLKIN